MARLVTPDVMVVDDDFQITGLPEESRPIKDQTVTVRVRVHGAWKFAATRNVCLEPPQKH